MRFHGHFADIAIAILFLVPLAAHAQTRQTCDVNLDVTDSDPKGLNVRSAPSTSSRVIAVLKPEGDWVEVHVTAQIGDWYLIDKATVMDNSLPTGEKVAFHGLGYVYGSKVGASGMDGAAIVLDKPDEKTGKRVAWDNASDAPVDVLGCFGPFYKVRLRKVTGWSKDVCTNELTTCV